MTGPPDCRDCKHHNRDEDTSAWLCTEYTDGGTDGAYFAAVYRSGRIKRGCGPEGRYFEARDDD